MNRSLVVVLIHVTFWLGTAWLIVSSFSIQSHEIELVNGVEQVHIVRSHGMIYQLILCICIALFMFYCITQWILNSHILSKKAIGSAALALLLSLLAVYFIFELYPNSNAPPLPLQISFGILIFYFAIAIAYSLVKLVLLNEKRHHQILLDKKQADLNLLRNQLQPHFLFNALNNLLSMVNPTQNPKLADAFERLSGLLRYVIEETKGDRVTISEEIKFLKNYIELQLLRYHEGEVHIRFDIQGNNTSQRIEPGLFIPFVENAFKYGTQPENVSEIKISFNLSRPDQIRFRIQNRVLMENNDGIGTGITSTQKRLELIYPGKHRLRITHEDSFLVALTITTI